VTAPSPKLTMRRYLEALRDEERDRYDGAALFVLQREGVHPNVVIAKAEKAWSKGYVGIGVSARFPWLTDKGRAYLQRKDVP
jgi:hypothetical protein